MSSLGLARSILADEAAALQHLASGLDDRFERAVELIVACANQGGTVLVTGLGKSGLIGAKISATMASLGIPSHVVHPSEAAHGDLGRFRSTDTVIAISFSGETDEVVGLAGILRQDGLPIISVTATLALGDALALCAARVRNFTSKDFARRHPGGALGGLLRPVTDVMRAVAGKNLPLIADSKPVSDALREASAIARRSGALLLVDASGRLSGLITDGDLRRLVLRDRDALDRPARDVMTKNPRTLLDAALVRDAVTMIREHRQDEIPIVDSDGRPVGLLDVQDLIAMRLIKD